MLRGRHAECRKLEQLIKAVRQRESRTLVIRGEAGVGKSALLDYLVKQASECRIVRVAGMSAEAEFAFAGLHQLCAPLLGHLDRIPGPQRDALGTAFGRRLGSAPDRFLLSLAVLSLLAEAAAERPLVCVIDDAQWLDPTSAQVLAFVARRLVAESVALVFALRDPADEQSLQGLPRLELGGLRPEDARGLLAEVILGPLDERVRDRIVAETRGNPLALLELPRGLTYVELAGGFGLPGAEALSDRIEDSFRRRLAPLPFDTHRLLLVAAAESTGDPGLVRRAASRLGIVIDEQDLTAFAGLVQWGERVAFRHPLARSAVYRAASTQERRDAHRTLAEVTNPVVDADRRAWHLAHATQGPDEDVAAELERSAGRAQARGGLAAAAAFLDRATRLTPGPDARGRRALAATQAKLQAGAFESAQVLLTIAQDAPLDEFQRARVDLLRAQIAYAHNRGGDATTLLLHAARRLDPIDGQLARDTYLEAISAAEFAGRLASGSLLAATRAARDAPAPDGPARATDLLLNGLAALIIDGYATGVPVLKHALAAFRDESLTGEEALRWIWLACRTAVDLWDFEAWQVLSSRMVRLAREAGALTALPLGLTLEMGSHLYAGELTAVVSLEQELAAIVEATGTQLAPYGALMRSAWQGRQAEASAVIDIAIEEAASRGEGLGMTAALFASALLCNGLGRYEDALSAASRGSKYPEDLAFYNWSLVELVEAASRTGQLQLAATALERLVERTRASGTDWALGLEERSRALISDDQDAEPLYRNAIDRFGRAGVRVELARTYLIYGEWLRRQRRRHDAREQLRTAYDMLTAMGVEAFAERARRELAATGETARKRTMTTSSQLTAHEALIARMAREGLSNPEIGTRLFLSPRTVEYHLRNVFAKLGIASRHELDRIPVRVLGNGQIA